MDIFSLVELMIQVNSGQRIHWTVTTSESGKARLFTFKTWEKQCVIHTESIIKIL